MSIRALSIAASGMRAQQTNVDVIANNLANANTVGFKKQRAEFTDLFYQHLRRAGAPATQDTQYPTGIQLGTGVRLVATKRQLSQGAALETKNEKDIMITGKGFFQLKSADGTTIAYTRNGSFSVDEDGRMVNSDGLLLEPEISVGTANEVISLEISTLGRVVAKTVDNAQGTEVGTIEIVTFANPSGLEARGGSVMFETEASGPPVTGQPGTDGRGTLQQGFLEGSNVDAVDELVDLITAQRTFELNSNTIQSADEMLQVANNLRR